MEIRYGLCIRGGFVVYVMRPIDRTYDLFTNVVSHRWQFFVSCAAGGRMIVQWIEEKREEKYIN